MAKNKKCSYCETKDTDGYRRLPNGLFACSNCYEIKNPLYQFGLAKYVWDNRRRITDKALRKAIEAEGKPPDMDKVYKGPIVQQAYKLLLKGKKVKVGS